MPALRNTLMISTMLVCVPQLAHAQQNTLPTIVVAGEGQTQNTQETGQVEESGAANGGISKATKDAAVVIGTGEINMSGPTDLQDIFSQETSASVGGSIPTAQKLYVHGIEENNLNVQIDGARQTNNLWHHNGGTLIDPSLLKAVEINPGVAPSDAGPGALGGAVRYETKDVGDFLAPDRDLGGYIYGAYDTNSNTFTRSGAAYGRASGFEILAFGSLSDGDDYEDGSGTTIGATAADLSSALGKVAYEAQTGHRFELSTDYVSDEGLRPYRANFASFGFPFIAFWPDTFTEFSRQTTVFNYTTTKPTDFYDPEVNFFVNEVKLSRRNQFDTKIESTGGKVENTFTTGPGTITAGLDYVQDKSNNRPAAGGSFSEKVSNFGIYTQARLEHMNVFRMSFGARGDFQEFTGSDGTKISTNGFSPNASVELDVFDRFTLLGSGSSTFGGIKLAEVGLLGAGAGYSPMINPEWADSMRFGGRFQDRGLTLETYYFKTTIDDVIDPFTAAARTNLGKLESEGVDVLARYDWRNAYLSFKYSHVNVELNNMPVTTLNFFVGTPVGDIFTLGGAYTWDNRGLTVGFTSEFVTSFDDILGVAGGPPPAAATFGELDSYAVVNLFADWQPKALKRLALRVEVNNIFDELYADRATSAGLSAVNALNEPGRSAKLSAKFTF